MLDDPLPTRDELRELIRKARAEQPFTSLEYQLLVMVLVELHGNTMYALKERMRRYAAEENAKKKT